MKLNDLATLLQAELVLPDAGLAPEINGDLELTALSPIATAEPGSLTFLTQDDYAQFLATTRASAIILAKPQAGLRLAQLVHKNPYWAFARAAQLFFPVQREVPGISPQAHVDASATVAATAKVYPFVYVAAGAVIGERSVLYPGVYIGPQAQVGADTVLRASVVIEAGVRIGNRVLIHGGAVIGADGFGFAPGEGGYAKIPQVGSVVVADDVEIGAMATIDRGALEDTVVGRGAKLDDHVHVGHGSQVGEHTVMCAFAGLAGSTRIGNWVVLGGHTGTTNRVEIVDKVQVGAMSGVTKDLKEPGVYMGFPARPVKEWRRDVARLRRLDEMAKAISVLTAKVAELSERN